MTASSAAVKGLKRKAAEDVIGTSVPVSPTPNPDHNDYTSKRPRFSSTNSDSDVSCDDPVLYKERKYVERRNKNNIASKRSRETRKQKYVNMEDKANQLELENKELDLRVREMEKLTKKMKDILVKRMAVKMS